MIPRIARRLITPILNRSLKDISDEDIWRKSEEKVSKKFFGPGNTHDWSWYFEGKSKVAVSSVSEIVKWLRGCSYTYDELLFNEKDFWQHPITFEETRKGDCEDFSLWAWRKLKELGVYAELVVGRAGPIKKQDSNHAWIIFEHRGKSYLMETVANRWRQMTYPLQEIQKKYCPAISVDTEFRTFRYGGALEVLRLGLNNKNLKVE